MLYIPQTTDTHLRRHIRIKVNNKLHHPRTEDETSYEQKYTERKERFDNFDFRAFKRGLHKNIESVRKIGQCADKANENTGREGETDKLVGRGHHEINFIEAKEMKNPGKNLLTENHPNHRGSYKQYEACKRMPSKLIQIMFVFFEKLFHPLFLCVHNRALILAF